ncbi:Ltp family lipoprotein [Modestobacter sp. SYSU DS0290]
MSSTAPVDEPASTSAGTSKKPVWKRWWFWVAAVLLVALFANLGGEDENTNTAAGTASTETSASSSSSEPAAETTEVVDPSTQAPAPAPTPAPAPAPEPAADEGTASQQQAVRSAERYLDFAGFSRQGLIDQLSSEYGDQFSVEDATWAVDHVEVDWNAEAAEKAKSYLEFTSFSRAGLIDQLTSEYGDKFTPEQAEYGVSQVGL